MTTVHRNSTVKYQTALSNKRKEAVNSPLVTKTQTASAFLRRHHLHMIAATSITAMCYLLNQHPDSEHLLPNIPLPIPETPLEPTSNPVRAFIWIPLACMVAVLASLRFQNKPTSTPAQSHWNPRQLIDALRFSKNIRPEEYPTDQDWLNHLIDPEKYPCQADKNFEAKYRMISARLKRINEQFTELTGVDPQSTLASPQPLPHYSPDQLLLDR